MKKDYFWFTIIALFILGYALDRISGPVVFNVRNPYLFFKSATLSTYPLTAVSVVSKAVALSASLILIVSYLVKSPFVKASVLFLLGSLAQLYTIQQLATRGTVTPIQWTLGIAYAGVCLAPFITVFILQGLFTSASQAIIKEIRPVRHDLKTYQANPPTES